MSLTESTTIKQIEIVHVGGAPAFIFRESENQIIKDGAVVASNCHRESYPADSDEAKAVLGDALAGALYQIQVLVRKSEQDSAEIKRLAGEVESLKAKVPQ